MTNKKDIISQIKKVMELVNEKKKLNNHKYLDSLHYRLHSLLSSLIDEDIDQIESSSLNGALRAYLDANLANSYEPLVLEMNELEEMLSENK